MTFRVHFEPADIDIECGENTSMLDAARQAGVPISAVCGGRGLCGKCHVRILSGELPPPLPVEERLISESALEAGYRFACLHTIQGDVDIESLPLSSHGKREVPGEERPFDLKPVIRHYPVSLEAPSSGRPIDDGSQLLDGLKEAADLPPSRIDYRVLQTLPTVLRGADWKVVAAGRGPEVVAVRPAPAATPPLGIAVDLGTTNIAAYLYNLEDGTQLNVVTAPNPLAAYGADILSRISYAQAQPEHGPKLQQILVKTLNLMTSRLTEAQGFQLTDVDEMVVVCNSGMHHLFLNLASRQLLRAPYVPADRHAMSIKARELGLQLSPGAYIYMPPLVGGFVGSDLIGVAVSTRIDLKPGVHLAVDIGTNTELLLSVDGQLFSCSCASGPALEGAALKFGSVALPGVVDRVWLDGGDDSFSYHTIQKKPAVGICGSGIIEALATMAETGIISSFGRVQRDAPGVNPDDEKGNHEFVLVPAGDTGLGTDLTISQLDIREIQLAKGAIRGGIETLLSEHDLGAEDIDQILVAGAFGNHIQVESALRIGLFPPVCPSKIRQVGNAAGTGAALTLLSESERAAAEEISDRIHYLELAVHPRFSRIFIKSQTFPEPSAGSDCSDS